MGIGLTIWSNSKDFRVSDAVLEKEYVYHNPFRMCISFSIRKGKPAGQIFGSGFFWSEAVDAAADIYNGVSPTLRGIPVVTTLINSEVRLLVDVDVSRAYRVV